MKTLLALPAIWALIVTCLIGCQKQEATYHLTCYSADTKIFEGEVTIRDVKQHWDEPHWGVSSYYDEDGGPIAISDNAVCLLETNRPRYEP